jgi:hypothetical protein
VLTSILFFDEIQRDQKGFATGEGIIIVGGFFSKEARESSYAKMSLGTFPKVSFTKDDSDRVPVKKLKKALEHPNIMLSLTATGNTMQKVDVF